MNILFLSSKASRDMEQLSIRVLAKNHEVSLQPRDCGWHKTLEMVRWADEIVFDKDVTDIGKVALGMTYPMRGVDFTMVMHNNWVKDVSFLGWRAVLAEDWLKRLPTLDEQMKLFKEENDEG